MTRLLLLIGVLGLAACSAPIVSIPPLPRDLAWHNPNNSGVLAVEATALRYVIEHWPPAGGAYAIELPPGTHDKSRAKVVARLPDGATTLEQQGGEPPTYRVAQVYMSGATARVDVVRPDEREGQRLVSVFETVDISGWYAQRGRTWDIPVDDALRATRAEPQEQGQ